MAVQDEDENSDKRHFTIKYRPDDKGYYIKDSGEGTGTFVKIDKPHVRFIVVKDLLGP